VALAGNERLESGLMPTSIQFDVFGKTILVARRTECWEVYYPGPDGKRRPAGDIVIPSDIAESELEQYLSDLCHEWATEKHPSVVRLTPHPEDE